jgi:hypothetical protein
MMGDIKVIEGLPSREYGTSILVPRNVERDKSLRPE